MTAGLGSNASDASIVNALANGVFYSTWRNFGPSVYFFVPKAAYVYDPAACRSCMSSDLLSQRYPLDEFLNEIVKDQDYKMQCSDNANLHSVLAAGQGVNAPPTVIKSTGFPSAGLAPTALYNRAGETDVCRIDCFLFHQVASLATLYDTSGRRSTTSLSSGCMVDPLQRAACTAGSNLFNLSQSTYLPLAFPTQSAASTTFAPVTVTIGSCSVP